MKRHRSAASLALAASVLLGLAGPVAAGEQVHFKGRLEGVVVTQTLLDPPFISVLVEGTPEQIKANAAVQEAYLGGVHAP